MTSPATKRSSRDRPALAGGTPVRRQFLPFSKIDFGREEEEAVVSAMRTGWIATGPLAERFEAAIARTVGVSSAVSVSSCTAAMHLLFRAAGVGPGDEVITSPMTFPATANAILHAGGKPVFADVLPGRYTLDPAAVRAALSPRTRAINPVHLAGWPCEMDELAEIAHGAGVALVEDAAHALGATYKGRPVGSLGDGAAFSFYATKNITTGDGGMITTDRSDWADRARIERLHGLDLDASKRDRADYRHWEAVSIGWKYNMTDICAALGLAQIEKLQRILARRRELDRRYREAFADVEAIEVLDGPPEAVTAAHLFPILIRAGALRIDRDEMLGAMLAENIGVGVHFRALPSHRFFRELGFRELDVPVAADAGKRTLSLPLYPTLGDAEQEDVIAAVRRIAEHYAA